jgi:hypothetical protein
MLGTSYMATLHAPGGPLRHRCLLHDAISPGKGLVLVQDGDHTYWSCEKCLNKLLAWHCKPAIVTEGAHGET